MPSLRSAALSDIGRVRRENEDRYICDASALLFGVADGVGGLPGGAEAAELAIREVSDAMRSRRDKEEFNLARAVQRANHAVARLGLELSPSMGIGTTLTFGHIDGHTLRLAHVGDSRCYLARKQEFIRLTEDHSVENEARQRRARGEVVYYSEANRSALTRCVGQPGPVDVDVSTRTLGDGDRLLFCTDGVTRMVSDAELAELVVRHDDPDEALRHIIALAVERGGPDNATGVLLHVDRA